MDFMALHSTWDMTHSSASSYTTPRLVKYWRGRRDMYMPVFIQVPDRNHLTGQIISTPSIAIPFKGIIHTYQYLYGAAEYSQNRCSPLLPDSLICSMYMTLQKAQQQASQLHHIDLLLP